MGNKRIRGRQAVTTYNQIFEEDGSAVASNFVLGDAQIDTAFGTFTAHIVETRLTFDLITDGPLCVSEPLDIGMNDRTVTIQISALLRDWTLINRD